MPVEESRIRDELAADLSVLEKGLSLVKTEHELSNALGAGGRVDILARDEFSNYVIIEIKKSNQTARQALHEIFKYSSILKHEFGLKASRMRTILVSTEWHELRLPFSAYLERSICHTTGYKVEVDARGRITRADRVKPVQLLDSLQFSEISFLYLYDDEARRQAAVESVSRNLTAVGVPDHVLVTCDYHGDDPAVIYPYGIHMLLAPQPRRGSGRISRSRIERLLSAFSRRNVSRDTAESVGPDSLAAMLQNGWQVGIARRAGRFQRSKDIVTDEDLLPGGRPNSPTRGHLKLLHL